MAQNPTPYQANSRPWKWLDANQWSETKYTDSKSKVPVRSCSKSVLRSLPDFVGDVTLVWKGSLNGVRGWACRSRGIGGKQEWVSQGEKAALESDCWASDEAWDNRVPCTRSQREVEGDSGILVSKKKQQFDIWRCATAPTSQDQEARRDALYQDVDGKWNSHYWTT